MQYLGHNSLKIISVTLSDNSLYVQWTTDITNIITIIVTATNTDSGLKTTVVVEPDITEVSIPIIDSTASYDVSVTIYDNCWRVITSELNSNDTNEPLPSSTGIPESSTSSSSSSSVSEETCSYSPTSRVIQTSLIYPRQTTVFSPCEPCSDDDGKFITV